MHLFTFYCVFYCSRILRYYPRTIHIEAKLDQLIAVLVPYDLKSEQGNGSAHQHDVRPKVTNIMKVDPRPWRDILRGVGLVPVNYIYIYIFNWYRLRSHSETVFNILIRPTHGISYPCYYAGQYIRTKEIRTFIKLKSMCTV